jgi:hypothetical protein
MLERDVFGSLMMIFNSPFPILISPLCDEGTVHPRLKLNPSRYNISPYSAVLSGVGVTWLVGISVGVRVGGNQTTVSVGFGVGVTIVEGVGSG